MDIKELEYFRAVCKYNSISKAAGKHYISQQGLSRIINNLEKELQIPLFYRTSHKSEITEYGELLFERTEGLIELFENIKKDIIILKERKEGVLKVGLSYGVLSLLAPTLFEDFLEKYPNVILKINEYPDKICEEEVFNENLDIGFCISPIDINKFIVHYSQREQIALMLSEKNPLSQKEYLNMQDIRNERFIAFGKETKGHEMFARKCREAGFEPIITIATYDMALINRLCRDNVGIAFYAGPVIPKKHIYGIKIVRSLEKGWFWETCLVSKRDAYLNDICRSFIDFFIKENIVKQ